MKKGQRPVNRLVNKIKEAAEREDWDEVLRATYELKRIAKKLLVEQMAAAMKQEGW